MKRSISRFAYRLLLGLHPASFQEEFGGEMLWIFEEEYKRGNAGYLLFDGTVSLLASVAGYRAIPVSYQLLLEQSSPVPESGQFGSSKPQSRFQ